MKRNRTRRGQGIAEYGAILGFVAMIVSLTVSATTGSFYPAFSSMMQQTVDTFNALVARSGEAE